MRSGHPSKATLSTCYHRRMLSLQHSYAITSALVCYHRRPLEKGVVSRRTYRTKRYIPETEISNTRVEFIARGHSHRAQRTVQSTQGTCATQQQKNNSSVFSTGGIVYCVWRGVWREGRSAAARAGITVRGCAEKFIGKVSAESKDCLLRVNPRQRICRHRARAGVRPSCHRRQRLRM